MSNQIAEVDYNLLKRSNLHLLLWCFCFFGRIQPVDVSCDPIWPTTVVKSFCTITPSTPLNCWDNVNGTVIILITFPISARITATYSWLWMVLIPEPPLEPPLMMYTINQQLKQLAPTIWTTIATTIHWYTFKKYYICKYIQNIYICM